MSGYRVIALLILMLTFIAAGVTCVKTENHIAGWSIAMLIGCVLAGVFYRLGPKS